MEKSKILKEIKKMELRKKIEELEKKRNILIEENNKYINQHLIIAEEELRKLVTDNKQDYIYKSSRLVNLDKLNIEYISDKGTLAGYIRKNNILEIDKNYLSECKCKEGINQHMIETLQHELIHYYCHEYLDKFKLFSDADSSPVFHSIITFFKSKGLKLKTNGSLDKLYREYHEDLYEIANQRDITFEILCDRLLQWQEKLKNMTNIIQEPAKYWSYDDTDNNCEISEYRNIKISEGHIIRIFQIGMDGNLENFEELINRK